MPQLTLRQIGLIVMMLGVVSIALHEPLARLDLLHAADGPHAIQQERLRLARRLIVGSGIGCLLLAAMLIRGV